MIGLSQESLRFGEELATITLGIDALDRRLRGSEDEMDGLVVINMGWHNVAQFENYAEARAALAELAKKSFFLPEPDRRLYYLQACMSLDSFCAFSDGKLPKLTDQVGMFLHADCAPVTEKYLLQKCAEVEKLLKENGYNGTLKEMAAKWEAENRVPADKVQSTMDELMVTARELTGKFLPLPEAHYKCVTEAGGPFSARSDYDHLQVVVNIEPAYTMQALKHLVVHEAYPGHYMQFTMRKELWKQGLAAADGLLSVCNHSSSSTFEGIADMGGRFIGWENTPDDKIFEILSEIKSSMGTLSSYQMNVLHWTEDQIRDYMAKWPLLGGEGAIKSRLNFVRDPSRAALIWSYWRGDQALRGVLDRLEEKDMPRFYDYIYGRLHTPASLQLFT